MTAEVFICPRCGAQSAHPKDAEEGYCGRCHDWTGPSARGTNREEHLAWCRERALGYVDKPGQAVASVASDLGKHPDTAEAAYAVGVHGMHLLLDGMLRAPEQVRAFVQEVTRAWQAPVCPGCGQPPGITLGGEQAFCGNDDCRVFTWDRSEDPALFKATAKTVELEDLGPLVPRLACDVCHAEREDPADDLCLSCREWATYWNSLSSAQQLAEQDKMDRYVDEVRRRDPGER